jgi:hypothetical protein
MEPVDRQVQVIQCVVDGCLCVLSPFRCFVVIDNGCSVPNCPRSMGLKRQVQSQRALVCVCGCVCVRVFLEGTNVNGLNVRCGIFGCSFTCGISCQRVVLCSCLLEGRVLLPVDGELSNSC